MRQNRNHTSISTKLVEIENPASTPPCLGKSRVGLFAPTGPSILKRCAWFPDSAATLRHPDSRRFALEAGAVGRYKIGMTSDSFVT
jgi:hypothetical protein